MLPQLDAPLEALSKGREEMWALVAALPVRAQGAPLREGAWSPLQQLEHVMLAEEAMLAWIRSGRDPGRKSLKGALSKLSLRVFFALGLKAKAPIPQVLPQDVPDLGEIQRRWDDTRRDLTDFLEGVTAPTLRQPVFRHPYVGSMDVLESLDFLRLHLRHHHRQITAAL